MADLCCCLIWAAIVILIYFILKTYGKIWRQRAFASIQSWMTRSFDNFAEDLKKVHYAPLFEMKSHDPQCDAEGKIKILEVGVGSGANFKYYPKNIHLTVVDPNPYFQPYFEENRKKFPDIAVDRFVVGSGEDMKEVADNSVDVVVMSLVLCSVTDIDQVLSEVKRVLTPGGKFFYWEHVSDSPGTTSHLIQKVLSKTIWPVLFDGCVLDRNIDENIEQAGFSLVEQKRLDPPSPPEEEKSTILKILGPFLKLLFAVVKPFLMGVATK